MNIFIFVLIGFSLSSSGCSFFGGGEAEADPPANILEPVPLEPIDLTVRVDLSVAANPLPLRFLVGIVVDTLVLPAEEWIVTSALLQSDTVIRFSQTWKGMAANQTWQIRLKGFDGGRWVVGSTWEGRTPKTRDTSVTLDLHPVYDGYFSPLDTIPKLNGLHRKTFSLLAPPLDDSLFRFYLANAEILDSTTVFKYPGAVNLVITHDSLFAADFYQSTHSSSSLPDSTLGSCRLLPLALGTRAGYQNLLTVSDMYSRWKEDSSTTSQPITEERWWLIREEDHLYILHAVSMNFTTGEQVWEWYYRD